MLLVQSTVGQNSSSVGTEAFTSNVTEGDLLFVLFCSFGATPNAPTDSLLNTWVNIVPYFQGPGSTGVSVWAAIANSSGPCVVSYSGVPSTAGEAAIFLAEWSGVSGVCYSGNESGASNPVVCVNDFSPLTAQSGTAILVAWQTSDTVSITPSPGTVRQDISPSSGAYAAMADAPFSIQNLFADFTCTWSSSDSENKDLASAMIFLFPPVSSGGESNSSFAS